VIVIEDVFGNALAGKPVINTFTMMAQGAVQTPTGPQTPREPLHTPDQNTTPDKLPSAGPAFPLAAGLNKFAFTGQWLIDWELYTDAPAAMQASIGHWGNTWHPSTEQNQFRKAQGKGYEERQHILRLRGQDRMRVIMLPYRKGEKPNLCTVEQHDGATMIRMDMRTLVLFDHGYASEVMQAQGFRRSLTAFGAELVEALEMRIAGGPAELLMTHAGGTFTATGPAGDRTVTLPKGWKFAADPAVSKVGNEWTVKYGGHTPLLVKVEPVS
jgi:hypothetical protein